MHRGRGTQQPWSVVLETWAHIRAEKRGFAAGRERGECGTEPVAYRDRVSGGPCARGRDRIRTTYLCSSTATAPHSLLSILPFHRLSSVPPLTSSFSARCRCPCTAWLLTSPAQPLWGSRCATCPCTAPVSHPSTPSHCRPDRRHTARIGQPKSAPARLARPGMYMIHFLSFEAADALL